MLVKTGRVFSLDSYRRWQKTVGDNGPVPDWTRACNGRPVLLENGTRIVIGLDGVCRESDTAWEAAAP